MPTTILNLAYYTFQLQVLQNIVRVGFGDHQIKLIMLGSQYGYVITFCCATDNLTRFILFLISNLHSKLYRIYVYHLKKQTKQMSMSLDVNEKQRTEKKL